MPENASSILMLAGIVLAIFFLMRGSAAGWMRSRRNANDPKEIERMLGSRSRDSALADAPAEVLRWQVEMHETARDLKAEIDSKLSALQALVVLARQEAERLEAAIRRAADGGIGGDDAPRDTLAAIERLADPAALDDPDKLAEVAAQCPSHASATAADPFHDNERTIAIARLADRGHSSVEIARRLGRPLGEVELLLGLRSGTTAQERRSRDDDSPVNSTCR